jgi:hypothetical protein
MRTPALEPVNNQQRRRRRRSSVRRPTLASRSYVLAFGCGHSTLTHRLRRRVPPPTRQPETRGAIGAKAHHATRKPVDNSSSFIDGRMNGVDLRGPGCLRRRAPLRAIGATGSHRPGIGVTSNLAVRALGCVPVSIDGTGERRIGDGCQESARRTGVSARANAPRSRVAQVAEVTSGQLNQIGRQLGDEPLGCFVSPMGRCFGTSVIGPDGYRPGHRHARELVGVDS